MSNLRRLASVSGLALILALTGCAMSGPASQSRGAEAPLEGSAGSSGAEQPEDLMVFNIQLPSGLVVDCVGGATMDVQYAPDCDWANVREWPADKPLNGSRTLKSGTITVGEEQVDCVYLGHRGRSGAIEGAIDCNFEPAVSEQRTWF